MYPNSLPNMRDAASNFGLIDSYDGGFARLQGTWNQDLIQPQEFAQQTLPDMLISGRKDLLGGLAYTDYDVDGTNFWRYHGQSGLRLDLNPRLTVPWRLGDYIYGFGTIGFARDVLRHVGPLDHGDAGRPGRPAVQQRPHARTVGAGGLKRAK